MGPADSLPSLPDSELDDTLILPGEESIFPLRSRSASTSCLGSTVKLNRARRRRPSSVAEINFQTVDEQPPIESELPGDTAQVDPGCDASSIQDPSENRPQVRRSLRRSIAPDRFQPY